MARRDGPPPDGPLPEPPQRQLERYLLRDEHIVVAVHRHWATIAEPVATAVLGLGVAVWASVTVAGSSPAAGDLFLWLWFAFALRALLVLYEWRREWYIATDRRLLLIYGFIVRKVDMMPLDKVTDLTYHRSVVGRILGYGTFVLESAGQDQALSKVNYIPEPDRTYRAMISEIFRRDGDEPEPPMTDAYAEEVLEEEDPTARLAMSERIGSRDGRRRRRRRAADDGQSRHGGDTAGEGDWQVKGGLSQRIARHVGPRRRPRDVDDGPDTESLPVTPGVTIFRSGSQTWQPERFESDPHREDPTRNRDD